MKIRLAILLAVVLAFSLASGSYASNMGFKLNMALASGTKYVAIPFFNSYTDATSLLTDILTSGATGCSVYNFNGSIWQRWSGGGPGQVNFTITAGKGYQVACGTGGNWIIVGSHDDTLFLTLPSGTSYISQPYHTTAVDATALLNEIQAATCAGVSVYKFNGSVWQRWTGGGPGQTNFTLTAGDAYQVAAGTGCSWQPAHF